jgi:hypothetical protein
MITIAFVGTASSAQPGAADGPPKPPAGEVRLESGRVVDYTIHFDRNSLQASQRVGDGLIALTSSGTLLRFELPTLRLVRERIGSEEMTCLGRGEGEMVLAGLSDGRVCRVDPTTLDLTDVAKLPSEPHWLGWSKAAGNRPAGLVAETRRTKTLERDGERWDDSCSVIHDLVTGKTHALDFAATTSLLDSKGRLWLGFDKGEWGGGVTRLDLIHGTVTAIQPPPSRNPDRKAFWEGVYGFVELRDGQVWTFGGTSHMGFNSGFIIRIDGVEPRPLFTFEPPREEGKAPDPSLPMLPITHIVEEDGGLFVFSYSDVFRVDKTLSSWKTAATLEISYRWGRPDAVGAYPSVCAVHPPRRVGEPYVLATVGDGYVLLQGTKATSHALPGQLGASAVHEIKNTSEGTFFSEGDHRLPIWRLGTKGWEVASLAPPLEPDPASDAAAFEAEQKSWYETRVIVGTGGMIYTVSETAVSPGTRTTARRVDGKSERVGRETSSLIASASFMTADGTLWNAFYSELKRFENGLWKTLVKLPEGSNPSDLEPLNTNGPPWLLLSDFGHLWRLEHGARGEDPRLTKVEIQEAGKAIEVHDAIPWSDGTLLFATSAGLRAYVSATSKLSKVDLPEPAQPAVALARDGQGRLWLGGGNGLWMAEPGGKTLEAFDRVPWLGSSAVSALSPDPERKDGIIVALGPRGVAFVRANQKP